MEVKTRIGGSTGSTRIGGGTGGKCTRRGRRRGGDMNFVSLQRKKKRDN